MLTSGLALWTNFFDISGDMIEVLHEFQHHTCFKKNLSGDVRNKAMVDLQHRS